MSNGVEQEIGGFSQAELSLAEAQRLINEEAQANPDKKKSKGRIRHILNNVNKVVNALDRVGALHPAAALVFHVYKGLLKLENDRRDNSEQIVVLFHSMARTLSVLSYLDQMVLVAEDPLTLHLGEVLNAFCVTMEEFGDLSDLYYNKCKQPVVRFFKASEFKGKIGYFEECFCQHRIDLQHILVIRNEVRTGEMSQGLEQLRINTERIIARLGEPSSEQEVKAIEMVRECGRDRVLHDKAKLEEVSNLVGGGKVSGNTQALLDTTLDDLLVANMEQFHRKLDSSMNQINESVNKSRDAILKKLDSGPHELIDDPDVQAVWKANSWKLSVKCRHFVDELSNHYEDKFRNEAAEEGANCGDHWTLPIFSKVMHHPAIGDAIDEDGSGFISLYEVNCFLKDRPDGWSVPEWLVYWAIGWKMNNVKYNEAVVDSLEDIKEKCKTIAELEDEDVQHQVQQYLCKIQIMERIASWSDSAHAEDTQDLSHEAEAKLQSLLDQSSKKQVVMITERLEELKWILDDPADLPVLLGGSDARIEQVFLTIAHLILGKQLEELTSKQLADGDWEIMTETLEMLIAVFHERMQSLLRGWRAQKLNVELHITCFAGGIYNGWYTAYYHPSGEMKRILEKTPAGHQAGSPESSQADTLATILTQMSHLTERVDHVDSRIDDIFSMLRTLLEAQSSNPNPTKKETEVRNSQLGIQHSPKKALPAVPSIPQIPSPKNLASQMMRSGSPVHITTISNKVTPNFAGHGKMARRLMEVGGNVATVGNKAGALLDGEITEGVSMQKGLVSDGDEFDFIVDNYAARPDGVEFPRMPGSVSRSQTQLTSPDTEETHTYPEQQTPQEYPYTDVVVAERPEPFNDFYTSAISKGGSADLRDQVNGSPAWPSSAVVTKTYDDYFQQRRPQTAPIVPTTEDMPKKIKHKKSGGIKGVKDSIRTRLTSFGSKSASGDDRDSALRSRAASSSGHQTSNDGTNQNRSQESTTMPQRQDFDRVEPRRHQWDGREYCDARPGVAMTTDETANLHYRGNAQRSGGPLNSLHQQDPQNGHHRPPPLNGSHQRVHPPGNYKPAPLNGNYMPQGVNSNIHYSGNLRRSDGGPGEAPAPHERLIKHPVGSRSVAGASPAWRNGWNGAPQWEEGQKPAPTYGTAL